MGGMKLIEKLAKDAQDRQMHAAMNVGPGGLTPDTGAALYIAGFMKARELAVSHVRMEPHMPPEANCLEFRIEQLGESEVV